MEKFDEVKQKQMNYSRTILISLNSFQRRKVVCLENLKADSFIKAA